MNMVGIWTFMQHKVRNRSTNFRETIRWRKVWFLESETRVLNFTKTSSQLCDIIKFSEHLHCFLGRNDEEMSIKGSLVDHSCSINMTPLPLPHDLVRVTIPSSSLLTPQTYTLPETFRKCLLQMIVNVKVWQLQSYQRFKLKRKQANNNSPQA